MGPKGRIVILEYILSNYKFFYLKTSWSEQPSFIWNHLLVVFYSGLLNSWSEGVEWEHKGCLLNSYLFKSLKKNLKIRLQKKSLTLMKVTSDNVDFNFSKFKCGFICFLFVCYNIIYNIIYMLPNCYVIDSSLWSLDKSCASNKFNVFYVG